MARIPSGSHPGGPGSIPGMRIYVKNGGDEVVERFEKRGLSILIFSIISPYIKFTSMSGNCIRKSCLIR